MNLWWGIDILSLVLDRINVKEKGKCSRVCKTWREIVFYCFGSDIELAKYLFINGFDFLLYTFNNHILSNEQITRLLNRNDVVTTTGWYLTNEEISFLRMFSSSVCIDLTLSLAYIITNDRGYFRVEYIKNMKHVLEWISRNCDRYMPLILSGSLDFNMLCSIKPHLFKTRIIPASLVCRNFALQQVIKSCI